MPSLRKLLRLCALGTVLLPVLAGCGGGGGGNGNNSGTTTTGTTTGTTSGTTTGNTGNGLAPTLSVSGVTRGLTATLAEDKAVVAVGGVVNYTLTLTNTTGASFSINAPSQTTPPAYLIVTDSTGAAVYNPIPSPPLTLVSLAPGQSLVQTVAVQVYSTTGTYTANASFSFSDGTNPTTVGPLTVTAQ